MGVFRNRIFLMSLAGMVVFSLTGCDLFSPSKKDAKKVTAEQVVAPPLAIVNEEGPLSTDTVARVGSWKLSTNEFNERLKLLKQGLPDFNEKDPQTKATVLNELIRQQLLVKDAEDSEIGSKKDIKDAVEDFRRTLLVQELANRITKDIAATSEEAQEYYNKNKELFLKWKVRQIVVADEAAAKALLVQILQGGDFAVLAKEQSKDKTASEGGLIADVAAAPAETQKVVAPLDTGGTSSVFKGPGGFTIVHVDEKKLEDFSIVKKDLVSGLTLRKQQTAILEHIDRLAKKTKVDVNNDLLGISDKK